MWVLFRVSDSRVIDIQPTRAEKETDGANYVFIEGATRDQLGGFVQNGTIVQRAVTDAERRSRMTVTNRQFRRALRGRNVRDQFETWLATAGEDHRDYFLHEPKLRRLHPSIEAARVGMSATHNQVDTFFADAASIE